MIKFSPDIVQIIQEKFNGVDLESLSIEELKSLRKDVVELRQQYNLLEKTMKTLGNAAYGASANPGFYFFNVELAGDITGECRHLTQTMIKNLEHLFHETLWENTELQERFDFKLDETKHDWYREQPVWVYSDTDSVERNSLLLIKIKNEVKRVTFDELYELVKNNIKTTTDTQKEVISVNDIEVLNFVDGQLKYTPIKHLIRHNVSKPKFKIKTKSGKEIVVTNDHSCIVFRNGEQVTIKASEINPKTDKLLTINYEQNSYNFEDIESIECLGNFDNEIVYDIEVDDNSHTFIANDILVHNSAYTTYGSLFKCMLPEYQKKYETDEAKLNWILKFNKEFLDGQNNTWCDELYGPRHGKNVHEFELETVARSAIYLKKKMYLKALSFEKGKYYPKYKMHGTGIELIKTTTPKLCREILQDLTDMIMFELDDDKAQFIFKFNDRLKEWKRKFWSAEYEDISQSIGVGPYKTYVKDDTNMLLFEKKAPVSVKAIATFNYMAHKHGEDNKKIYSGKIKYYRYRETLSSDPVCFGFPSGELPEWAPQMDKYEQWVKTVITPINRFLEVMGIPINIKQGNDVVQLGLFD